MKFLLLTLAAALTYGALNAQTNAPAAAPPPVQVTEVSSESGDFYYKSNVYVYRRNVRVNNPEMKLTCELLTATASAKGNRIKSIVAEDRVVLETVDENGQTNRATGDRLVYTCSVTDGVTNELAVLTGNPPRLEKPGSSIVGDAIIWDRAKSKITVTNQKMIFQTEPSDGTNKPPSAVEKPSQ